MNASELMQALKQYQPHIPRTSDPIYIMNITSQKSKPISWMARSWPSGAGVLLPLLMESQAFALQREAASNYVRKHVSTDRAGGNKTPHVIYGPKYDLKHRRET